MNVQFTPGTPYNGPLDITRRLNAEATQLDELATVYDDPESSEYHELQAEIKRLDQLSPLRGEEVTIYGNSLTLSVDEESNTRALALTPHAKAAPVQGKYHGYVILPAFFAEANFSFNSVLHMVQTGHYNYVDEFYNAHSTTYFSYVWAPGSQINPVMPKHAHSLEDLHGDTIAEEFDVLAFDETRPASEVIRHIGSIANRMIQESGPNEALNRQRISYLNSLGVAHNVKLSSREVVLATRENYLTDPGGKSILYSSNDAEPLVMQPDMIDILPGYARLPNGQIFPVQQQEVFATAKLKDGRRAMMPLKHVEHVTRTS